MSLRERLAIGEDGRQGNSGPPGLAAAAYQELKKSMHQTIMDRIDLERLQRLTPEQFKHELALLVQRIIEEERIVLNQHERHNLVLDIQHEMLGFGPLEPLLADPGVSDILVNTHAKVYVERAGRLELTSVTFNDNAHLMKIIEKIVSRVGRRVDESSPMVDARLPDGSRVNAIIPPLAIDGPMLSIRRFAVQPLTVAKLLAYKSLTPPMVQVLEALGADVMHTVPNDYMSATDSVNQGIPVLQLSRSSAVARSLADLVELVTARRVSESKGLFDRLFGRADND